MIGKDTVMSFKRLQEIDLKNASSNFTDALYDVAREQAEISFKLGIKEVVDWIQQLAREHEAIRQFHPDRSITLKGAFKPIIFDDEWQAKLKEWGLE